MMDNRYSRERWMKAVTNGDTVASYSAWARKTREADAAKQSQPKESEKTMTNKTERGRAVSPETKARIERLIVAGLSKEEAAGMLDLNVESVDRALRVTLDKFTQEEVSIITLALGMLRGRKDRNYHDDREFDQLLLQSNAITPEMVEALHKRVSANGLMVDAR